MPRHPGALAVLVGAFGLSALGDYLALTALIVWTHDHTGSAWAVTGLVLAGLAPLVLLAPAAGLVVDRFAPAPLLLPVLLLQSAAAAAAAAAPRYPTMLLLVFLLGAGAAFTQAALLTLVPVLAGRSLAGRVTGRLEAARAVGTTLGPPLGGVVSAVWGVRQALLADAATFALLGAAVLTVRSAHTARRPAPPPHTASGMTEGARHLIREPALRLAVATLCGTTMFVAAINVAEVFFAKDVLRAGDVGYGVLVGCWGGGMVLGALLAGRSTTSAVLLRTVLASCVLLGAALVLPAALPWLPLALACWALGGAANGAFHVAVRGLIHRRTPAELHGRVFAAQYGAYTAAKIVAIMLGGLLISVLPARGVIAVAGAGALVVAAAGLALHGAVPSGDGTTPGPRRRTGVQSPADVP
jgi:MFS family permease